MLDLLTRTVSPVAVSPGSCYVAGRECERLKGTTVVRPQVLKQLSSAKPLAAGSLTTARTLLGLVLCCLLLLQRGGTACCL